MTRETSRRALRFPRGSLIILVTVIPSDVFFNPSSLPCLPCAWLILRSRDQEILLAFSRCERSFDPCKVCRVLQHDHIASQRHGFAWYPRTKPMSVQPGPPIMTKMKMSKHQKERAISNEEGWRNAKDSSFGESEREIGVYGAQGVILRRCDEVDSGSEIVRSLMQAMRGVLLVLHLGECKALARMSVSFILVSTAVVRQEQDEMEVESHQQQEPLLEVAAVLLFPAKSHKRHHKVALTRSRRSLSFYRVNTTPSPNFANAFDVILLISAAQLHHSTS